MCIAMHISMQFSSCFYPSDIVYDMRPEGRQRLVATEDQPSADRKSVIRCWTGFPMQKAYPWNDPLETLFLLAGNIVRALIGLREIKILNLAPPEKASSWRYSLLCYWLRWWTETLDLLIFALGLLLYWQFRVIFWSNRVWNWVEKPYKNWTETRNKILREKCALTSPSDNLKKFSFSSWPSTTNTAKSSLTLVSSSPSNEAEVAGSRVPVVETGIPVRS